MNFENDHMKGGIVLVDKPPGLTSHDVVDFIRKKFRFKKVGHAGTLDPFATGLLIILLGDFTKRSLYFSNYEKEYEATLVLGISTDTQDRSGKIVSKKDPALCDLSEKAVKDTFGLFRGEIEQIPPMYSAKKIKGRKLYEFARKGLVLSREPKRVFISEIKVSDISLPRVEFRVTCSKGTYIRQLAHDIGEKIGCGAHLDSLRRTKIGPFEVYRALPLEKLDTLYENILQPA